MAQFFTSKKEADAVFLGKHPSCPADAKDADLVFYYTGKPCGNGLYALRYAKKGSCACSECVADRKVSIDRYEQKKWDNLANGQFTISQRFLEIQEDKLRRQKAKDAGLSHYESVNPCKHNFRLKTVNSGSRVCKMCCREKNRRSNDIANQPSRAVSAMLNEMARAMVIEDLINERKKQAEENAIAAQEERSRSHRNLKEKRAKQMAMKNEYENEIIWTANATPPKPSMHDSRLDSVWR